MTEEIKAPDTQVLAALIQKNLEIVHKALGIETTTELDELGEPEPKPKLVLDEVAQKSPAKKLTTEELAEKKRYLAAKYIDNQAIFAELKAQFAKLYLLSNGCHQGR